MHSALPSTLPLSNSSNSISESVPVKLALVVAGTGLLAICAHISLPLPFTLIPLTLQTFAVVLIGMVLGPVAGFSSMVLYLAEGAAGLPVFSPHGLGGVARLLGPSAGYLFSYPLAAALGGLFTRSVRLTRSNFSNAIVAGGIASLPILFMGAAWLGHFSHLSAAAAWHVGAAPFIPGEIVKVTAAAGIFSTIQRWRKS